MKKLIVLIPVLTLIVFALPGSVARADWHTTGTYTCSTNTGLSWLQGNAEAKIWNTYNPPNGHYKLFESINKHWASSHGNKYGQDWIALSSHASVVTPEKVRVEATASISIQACLIPIIGCIDVRTANPSCKHEHGI